MKSGSVNSQTMSNVEVYPSKQQILSPLSRLNWKQKYPHWHTHTDTYSPWTIQFVQIISQCPFLNPPRQQNLQCYLFNTEGVAYPLLVLFFITPSPPPSLFISVMRVLRLENPLTLRGWHGTQPACQRAIYIRPYVWCDMYVYLSQVYVYVCVCARVSYSSLSPGNNKCLHRFALS